MSPPLDPRIFTRSLMGRMSLECGDDLTHRFQLDTDEIVDTAVILGTGWGDAFPFEATHTTSMHELAGYSGKLDELDGHQRRLELGTVDLGDGKRKRIIVQRGRVHMNEGEFNPFAPMMVRLQIESLIAMGVTKFVMTCAVGAIWDHLREGDLYYITDFLSWGSDVMPLFPGEFVNPAACIDLTGANYFKGKGSLRQDKRHLYHGPHIMFYGPHFESIADKRRMKEAGAGVVGMSIKPECTIAALYPDVSVRPIALVTNDNQEAPDHKTHRDRAKEVADKLAMALKLLI